MKIHAEHVFYLSFMLPELKPPERLALDIHVQVDGDYHALVVGWDRSDPLFVGDLGATLSTAQFSMQPVWRPAGILIHRVQDTVVDRLIVSLEWETDVRPTEDPLVTALWLNRAVSTANYVLGHLRVVTQVPQIRPIRRYWKPDDPGFAIEVPHTIRWINSTDQEPLPMFSGVNGFCSTGALRIPNTGSLDLQALGASLASGTPPPLSLSLLVDAEEALTTLRLREAVICIASACEIASGAYLQRQTLMSNNQTKNVGKGKPFTERYFHELPLAISNRSFRSENTPAYNAIQECYDQRNGLAHGGKLRSPLKGLYATKRGWRLLIRSGW